MLESSDTEFWEHLDDHLILGKKEPKRPQEIVIINDEAPKPEPEKKPVLTLWDFDRQKSLTERILTSGLQKAKEEEIRVKNQTKKEFYPVIQESIYTFKKDIAQMVTQHQSMKEKLSEIQNYMLKIENTLNYQYKATSKMEIFMHREKALNTKKKVKPSPLIHEISLMQVQASCLREVTAEYHKDADKVSEKVEKVQKEIVQLKEAHQVKIAKLKNFYLQKESAIHQEIDQLKAQYSNYKLRAELELDLRNIIKKRQVDFVGKLYTELGNSKFIIQNPRLRMQYHRKVNRSEIVEEDLDRSESVDKRNGMFSRGTKYSDGRESFSLAQTRPVTNDLRGGVKKCDDEDPFAIRVVTRVRNVITPLR